MASVALNRFTIRFPNAPWRCFFCEWNIWSRENTGEGLVVHHKSGDHTDHSWDNLAPAHRRCHSKHHRPKGTIAGPNPKARENVLKINARKIDCPNGCGLKSNPGAIATHSRGWTCPNYEPS